MARGSRIGIGLTVRGVSGADIGSGTVYMAVGRGGYVGLTRTADGGLNLAAAVTRREMQAAGGPHGIVRRLLSDAGLPTFATSQNLWRGTIPLARRSRMVAGPRIFLVGDAAGYVEPFTGEGIAWALSSSAAVAPLVVEGVLNWRDQLASDWRAVHRHMIRRDQFRCRLITALSRNPTLARLSIRTAAAVPSLVQRLLKRMNTMPAGCS